MKGWSFMVLLTTGVWVATAATGAAAERAGGVRVDVERGGVHVDVGTKNDQANAPVVKVRDLIGVRVYSPSDDNLGKIEDLVTNPSSGKVRYAVLSFGGFLGMGDKLFAVPWADLKLVSKGTTSAGTVKEDHYVLDVSKEALKNAPGFDKINWPDFASRTWSADVDKFYTSQRAGGARVDVDRAGVHVDVGAKDDQTDVPVVKVRDLIGVRVYNPSNENLGKIEDLVMNSSSGAVRYAVLSFGGFLSMGDKLFAVPWPDLKLVSKGTTSAGTVKEDYYVLNVSKDALKNAPGFDKSNWPDFAKANWSADVDKFYTGRRAPAATTEPVDRTNTGVNRRDRDGTATTPMDQNENNADIAITANIRKRVVATQMSVNAHNVKIITQAGKVTLRGPVNTAQEKQTIEDIARDVAGVNNVDSQLEVNNK